MKKIVFSVAVLMSMSTPVVANAEQGLRPVAHAYCNTQTTIHPDGSIDEIRICHTDTDGTR